MEQKKGSSQCLMPLDDKVTERNEYLASISLMLLLKFNQIQGKRQLQEVRWEEENRPKAISECFTVTRKAPKVLYKNSNPFAFVITYNVKGDSKFFQSKTEKGKRQQWKKIRHAGQWVHMRQNKIRGRNLSWSSEKFKWIFCCFAV